MQELNKNYITIIVVGRLASVLWFLELLHGLQPSLWLGREGSLWVSPTQGRSLPCLGLPSCSQRKGGLDDFEQEFYIKERKPKRDKCWVMAFDKV